MEFGKEPLNGKFLVFIHKKYHCKHIKRNIKRGINKKIRRNNKKNIKEEILNFICQNNQKGEIEHEKNIF